jgi:Dolichyl-phosphate-mannose-protein mannosyltransferase
MIESRFRRPPFWIMSGLLAIAAYVRFRSIGFGLPHTQARPDETAIIDPVLALLSGRLPHFYDYPWLFLWVVATAYLGYYAWGAWSGTFGSVRDMLASWPLHWEPFFLIPRIISATVGTLSVLVVFRLGRQLRNQATGLVAALFLAFTYMHVRNSHFGTTDVTMTCLILCAVSLLLDAHRSRSRLGFIAAGIVAGLAAATKYSAVFLVVPMLASHALTVIDAPGRRAEAILDDRVAYFGLGFALSFAIGVPFIVLDRAPFLAAMGELAHALSVGDARLALSNGWLHHLVFSLRYGVGLPLLVIGLCGAVALLWREPRTGVLFLSFPVAYYAVAGSFRLLFFRYVLPVLPFLSVTAAYMVCLAAEWLTARVIAHADRQALFRPAATALLAIAVVGSSVVTVWEFDRVLGADDSRVVVARWFFDNVPTGSTLLQSGSRYGLVQFWDRRFAYKEWRWDGGRRVFLMDGARLSASDRPDWIIVQDSPLPSATQEVVTQLLRADYVRAADFTAFTPADDLIYDQQDAFFVPFAGFDHVVRPGPNFSVYRREGVPVQP